MKITVVTETFPPEVNGVAMTLYRITQGLIEQGHQVQIIRPQQSPQDQPQDSENLQTLLVKGLPLPGYSGLCFGLPSGKKIKQYWQDERPDIVYLATEGPLGLSALRAARKLKIPLTSGFHTNFQSYMQHYHLGWLRPLILKYLKSFHNKTAITFVPSQDIEKQLHAFGIHHTKILGRGVDTQLFHPSKRSAQLRQQWGLGEQDIAFGYVGRLAAEKNIQLSLQAFRSIQKQIPQAKFIAVGHGPESENLQKSYPDCIFCGMQEGEALAQHYASIDVFLFASTTETFGNVVTEGLASGQVVLAYDYAAPQALITDGENGYLARYDDTEHFLEKAQNLCTTTASWPAIKDAAHQSIQHISWSSILDKFIIDIKSLTEHPNDRKTSAISQ